MNSLVRHFVIPLMALALGVQGTAVAGVGVASDAASKATGVTGTEAMLNERAPESEARQTVEAQLARNDVRAQMLAMGVDPNVVDTRVAALSETEMAELADSIETAPAGGSVIGVIGVVFVVLLVLELVGAIDVFKAI